MVAHDASGGAAAGDAARRRFAIVAPSPSRPHAHVVDEVVETLVAALRALGHAGEVVHGRYADATNIVLSTTLGREPLPRAPEDTIIYNLEQLDRASPWFPPPVRAMFQRHVVWDYSAKNLANLRAAGLAPRSAHVPIGYVPQLTRIAPAPVQDVDVLFYGSMNERRDRLLRTLGRRGLKVMHVFNAYGAKRDAFIARAKIVLNVHYYAAQVFEMVRVSYLLANRKAVATEAGPDTDLDPALRDAVAAATYESLPDAVEALARDDALRAALEVRGFEAFRARPQTATLAAALAALE